MYVDCDDSMIWGDFSRTFTCPETTSIPTSCLTITDVVGKRIIFLLMAVLVVGYEGFKEYKAPFVERLQSERAF